MQCFLEKALKLKLIQVDTPGTLFCPPYRVLCELLEHEQFEEVWFRHVTNSCIWFFDECSSVTINTLVLLSYTATYNKNQARWQIGNCIVNTPNQKWNAFIVHSISDGLQDMHPCLCEIQKFPLETLSHDEVSMKMIFTKIQTLKYQYTVKFVCSNTLKCISMTEPRSVFKNDTNIEQENNNGVFILNFSIPDVSMKTSCQFILTLTHEGQHVISWTRPQHVYVYPNPGVQKMPFVNKLIPSHGCENDYVCLYGKNLSAFTRVCFGKQEACIYQSVGGGESCALICMVPPNENKMNDNIVSVSVVNGNETANVYSQVQSFVYIG